MYSLPLLGSATTSHFESVTIWKIPSWPCNRNEKNICDPVTALWSQSQPHVLHLGEWPSLGYGSQRNWMCGKKTNSTLNSDLWNNLFAHMLKSMHGTKNGLKPNSFLSLQVCVLLFLHPELCESSQAVSSDGCSHQWETTDQIVRRAAAREHLVVCESWLYPLLCGQLLVIEGIVQLWGETGARNESRESAMLTGKSAWV